MCFHASNVAIVLLIASQFQVSSGYGQRPFNAWTFVYSYRDKM